MTRREGRDASERRSGIEEDERPPEMAQLPTSNLVILVPLRKGNHPGKA